MSETLVRIKREHKIDNPEISGDWVLINQKVKKNEDGLLWIECSIVSVHNKFHHAFVPSHWIKKVD